MSEENKEEMKECGKQYGKNMSEGDKQKRKDT